MLQKSFASLTRPRIMGFTVDRGEDEVTVLVDVRDLDDVDALVAAIDDAQEALHTLEDSMQTDSSFLEFTFETAEGERLDDEFFERACEYERVRERSATFLRTYLDWLDDALEAAYRRQMGDDLEDWQLDWIEEQLEGDSLFLWRDDESPTLLWAAYHLAMSDERYVELYADFIQTTDMDHEVYQYDHIDDFVAEYGWTPEIEELLVARVTVAAGQHGFEQYRAHASLIRENLSTPRHESSLFDAFLEYYDTLSEEWIDTWAEDHGEPVLDDDEYDAWMDRVERTYGV